MDEEDANHGRCFVFLMDNAEDLDSYGSCCVLLSLLLPFLDEYLVLSLKNPTRLLLEPRFLPLLKLLAFLPPFLTPSNGW